MVERNLLEVKSATDGGKIQPELPLAEVKRRILDEATVVVLKDAFSGAVLDQFRSTVQAWAKATPIKPAQTYADENFHAIERGLSPRQKTLHLYHGYNFARIDALSQPYADPLLKVYEPLRDLYCRLVGRETHWNQHVGQAKFRPQVIHYPRGGGHLATHVHPLAPQIIGFILSISRRGRDFDTGAVGFEAADGTPIDTADHHDFGDIVMFKFDVKHWVTPVDIEAPLDLADDKGRWVVTLPLN
jgi:hypothetical protein